MKCQQYLHVESEHAGLNELTYTEDCRLHTRHLSIYRKQLNVFYIGRFLLRKGFSMVKPGLNLPFFSGSSISLFPLPSIDNFNDYFFVPRSRKIATQNFRFSRSCAQKINKWNKFATIVGHSFSIVAHIVIENGTDDGRTKIIHEHSVNTRLWTGTKKFPLKTLSLFLSIFANSDSVLFASFQLTTFIAFVFCLKRVPIKYKVVARPVCKNSTCEIHCILQLRSPLQRPTTAHKNFTTEEVDSRYKYGCMKYGAWTRRMQ